MNISTQTVEMLENLFTVNFYNEHSQIVKPIYATEIVIGFDLISEMYIGKTIKATKKEITLDYVLSKINSDKVYTNFCKEFNKIIRQIGTAYATSYGIGVFIAFGFRKDINESKAKIESALNELGIKFNTEYSDAGWVFRYKISKSKENIKIIESI